MVLVGTRYPCCLDSCHQEGVPFLDIVGQGTGLSDPLVTLGDLDNVISGKVLLYDGVLKELPVLVLNFNFGKPSVIPSLHILTHVGLGILQGHPSGYCEASGTCVQRAASEVPNTLQYTPH